MKDKQYFFHPDWKTRKKKFLRLCEETVFTVEKFREKEKHTKRIEIWEIVKA